MKIHYLKYPSGERNSIIIKKNENNKQFILKKNNNIKNKNNMKNKNKNFIKTKQYLYSKMVNVSKIHKFGENGRNGSMNYCSHLGMPMLDRNNSGAFRDRPIFLIAKWLLGKFI